jgi:hypothetical protein
MRTLAEQARDAGPAVPPASVEDAAASSWVIAGIQPSLPYCPGDGRLVSSIQDSSDRLISLREVRREGTHLAVHHKRIPYLPIRHLYDRWKIKSLKACDPHHRNYPHKVDIHPEPEC